ncbi:E3 ubiquitin-protein ligase TRIM21-like [Eucyclogobius newberryi]|uniref:E3 ubiquitin-protein ligase TRIM21-like n=1 Tax=Eucyclogobius newberryi TaxID=166745 RepID=UPI003B5CCF9A
MATFTRPGEVLCNHCPEPKQRAVNSCFQCGESYCETHRQTHSTAPLTMGHQLKQLVPNLKKHLCPEHNVLLELYCKEHSHFMCIDCYLKDNDHQVVRLEREHQEMQATLKEQIERKRHKILMNQNMVKSNQNNSEQEIKNGFRVFDTLRECQDKFKKSIVEKQKRIEEEADQLKEQIQTEISGLKQRGAEMKQLWSSGEHLQLVQTFTSDVPAPQLHDWTEQSVRELSYGGRVIKALSELKNTLNTEMEKLFKAERVQMYKVDVSLDPNTAHPNLVLSEDLKQVHHSDQGNHLPDSSERFSSYTCVLGGQKFSFGMFYFEVQVEGKTRWALGVAKESVDRKLSANNPQTVQRGFWTLYKVSDVYQTSEEPCVRLPARSAPEKVGVYVDYDEGLVSFYDVGEESLIYSFTDCDFTENILPLFNPCGHDEGSNSAPLVLLD